MAEKVTEMVLKVDLQCSCCYKKIKKLLCKFPQVRDQMYDDKQNQVIITVVCCSPEKFRDKLCCKGGKVIKSIDIKEPTPNKQSKTHEKQETKEEGSTPNKQSNKKILKEEERCPHPCPPIHIEVRCPPYPDRGCCGSCPTQWCRVSRCDYYFSEENPQGCTII